MSVRTEGSVCILTAQDAAILWQAAKLRELRIYTRSEDSALAEILRDIWSTALLAMPDRTVSGNGNAVKAETREAISNEVLTVKEVADMAGITPRTIRNHITAGILPAAQMGREWIITRQEADTYVAGRKKD